MGVGQNIEQIECELDYQVLVLLFFRLMEKREEMIEKINSNTLFKTITVRHPLDRLVSAYRDKFGNGVRNYTYVSFIFIHNYT